MKIENLKTKLTLAIISLLISLGASAQAVADNSGFVNAITNAEGQINGIFIVLSRLMLAVGGIVGVVGAIRIYIKWNNGDQDVTKAIVGWGGACLFLLLSGGVIQAVFKITGA